MGYTKTMKDKKNGKTRKIGKNSTLNVPTMNTKSGYIEYKMPYNRAKNLLADRKGQDARLDPQTFLCNVVNSTYGLKGYCTRVIIEG